MVVKKTTLLRTLENDGSGVQDVTSKRSISVSAKETQAADLLSILTPQDPGWDG